MIHEIFFDPKDSLSAKMLNLFNMLYLLDASVLVGGIIFYGLTPRKRIKISNDQVHFQYNGKIIECIEMGELKDCAISQSTLEEFSNVASQKDKIAKSLSEWMLRVKNNDKGILYLIYVPKEEREKYYGFFPEEDISLRDKDFTATLISTKIPRGVSNDNHMYRMQNRAVELHRENNRCPKYEPLSIITSKDYCQIHGLKV